jgi:TolA-binding protein
MRADILASEVGETKLDEAITGYKQAFRAANAAYDDAPSRAKKQATYATFQLATVYDLLASAYKGDSRIEYYEKVVQTVRDYLDFYGTDANISKGIYWIGKTLINQGKVDEAVQSYLDAVVQYGDDLEQDGVDSMIAELVGVSRRFTTAERDRMIATLQSAIAKAENLTLQLRLRALLAQLNGDEVEFGKDLIATLYDLSVAAPPVLAAISKASFENEDYSRAAEILRVFKAQFDDSEFIRPAYKLRAFGLYKSGDFENALKVIDDTQGRYGTDRDVVWAQLMKADILIQQGKYDKARDELMMVFNVVSWRGEPFAEATYRLGQLEEAAGNLRKAFGWYQRTYFQYKAYAKCHWAAEAYLASARCLEQLGLLNDQRNTYRAMIFDRYVNKLPQADVARNALGPDEVLEIIGLMTAGTQTNITVTLDEEAGK